MTTPSVPGYETHGAFPHVVIRYMACAYGRIEVAFLGQTPAPQATAKLISVPCAAPSPGEPLTAEVREAVVAATAALVERSGRRCCAVFATNDVVYVEPDGTRRAATDPPSGGVRYDSVENTVTGTHR
ncbi:MAG: hypothetical protein Q8O67_31790 [Deltaproteobacteria bacterium]|nr:hypothetical protein [Deltaproteobacteria bacterium]